MLRLLPARLLSPGACTNEENYLHQNSYSMYKHLFLISLLTLAAAVVQARSSTITATPVDIAQRTYAGAEQNFSAVGTNNYDKEYHGCECHKCQKGKKGKKGKGHHSKHSCSCHHGCKNNNGHNRNDDRCRHGRNDRDDNDCRYSNRRRQDDTNRRYEENSRGQSQGSRGNSRAGQHTSKAKVKTRPVSASNPTSSPSRVQKRKAPAPFSKRS